LINFYDWKEFSIENIHRKIQKYKNNKDIILMEALGEIMIILIKDELIER
jgi:hypothetical protein